MPSMASNKNRTPSQMEKEPNITNHDTATRPNTRRNGTSIIIEELQEIKDSLEGRKYLKKLYLLCPPGEPASHQSLYTCLHQISALSGIPKPAVNAIRAIAFLLEELEDTHLQQTLKDTLDTQVNEVTTNIKLLTDDAGEKIVNSVASNIKLLIDEAREKIGNQAMQNHTPTSDITQDDRHNSSNNASTNTNTNTNSVAHQHLLVKTYASALINPPPHANPKLAAREGIKARQFALTGIQESAISHLNNLQLKDLLNNTITELGMTVGKIRSVISVHNKGIII